jgi:hypothetical protein
MARTTKTTYHKGAKSFPPAIGTVVNRLSWQVIAPCMRLLLDVKSTMGISVGITHLPGTSYFAVDTGTCAGG